MSIRDEIRASIPGAIDEQTVPCAVVLADGSERELTAMVMYYGYNRRPARVADDQGPANADWAMILVMAGEADGELEARPGPGTRFRALDQDWRTAQVRVLGIPDAAYMIDAYANPRGGRL